MDKESLEAIRQIVREEIEPLKAGQKRLEDIIEESLALHDELESRVRALEAQTM